ncbi:LPS assembly lipoprotein LptE [Alteromonas lipotrueiana]|uniref:LPS-assembly lipoprotein LptE n=1 Tax=Alteromonas lipotrueiana TaxID=2803815 RepID=UPI001C47B949|nr:LPS assembly lipoprotein LptE [Alteromonas lipotrueiana]
MKRTFTLLIALACLTLAGCGFSLRGSQALPAELQQVALSAVKPHALLKRELKARLKVYQIPHIEASELAGSANTVLIRLQPETLERRLLSVFSTGQVAEYELIYGVNYQVVFPNKEPLYASFEVLRDYQDDPDKVLAKSRELDLVVSEMRREAADRIIRQLARQASGQ